MAGLLRCWHVGWTGAAFYSSSLYSNSPVCFVIRPVALVLHPRCKGGSASAVPLVKAPVAVVAVTIGAGVNALPVPHISEAATLHDRGDS